MLPENTELGELHIEEVYDYLDMPVCFLAKSHTGNQYLVYWNDAVPSGNGWLYVKISNFRLGQLKRNEISVRLAFINPENGYVIQVYTLINGDFVTEHHPEYLDDEKFPRDDHYIENIMLWRD